MSNSKETPKWETPQQPKPPKPLTEGMEKKGGLNPTPPKTPPPPPPKGQGGKK
jgi:hypothetical protein